MELLLLYYIVTNLLAFMSFFIDKRRAKSGAWRISEQTLLILVWIGGAFGAYVAMRLFRHKTLKPKFRIGVPVAILVHAGITSLFIF
ncbi:MULTISPECIES: DUF1294 domain-containing protein [Exiguobacterium]|uniref:DUF1294 domain-containing protein n=1 Tax=Exiguobacterium TaxID=33986 RepID=UPI00055437BE|nr:MULTISPECIES: DUF1294 domain-containing protein [Exiguobacterium]TCI54163.1 DUF1294 domain-containing protein [Exiguobacterium sp. SH1S21]TCI59286.1 DUF1294 domain-containing protein [Exiguobacterium sp. SH3S1]